MTQLEAVLCMYLAVATYHRPSKQLFKRGRLDMAADVVHNYAYLGWYQHNRYHYLKDGDCVFS